VNRPCPHCAANGIKATLERVTTARGEVDRCWQCGGEYRDGVLVWPRTHPEQFHCPKCQAPAGVPCFYLTDGAVHDSRRAFMSAVAEGETEL